MPLMIFVIYKNEIQSQTKNNQCLQCEYAHQ